MSPKGKKLLIITASVMLVLFIVLFFLATPKKNVAGKNIKGPASSISSNFENSEINLQEEEASLYQRPIPSVKLSRKLQEMASNKYVANRLKQAIELWELSIYLNESNSLSLQRLEIVKKQFDDLIQEIVATGNLDYKNLRYKRAINHWEKVLNLIEDKNSPVYKKTLQKINLAKMKLQK